MRIAKCYQMICQTALVGSALFVGEAAWSPQQAKAEQSLNPNEVAFVNYNLPPGNYVLEATSFWGDVDVKVYNSRGQFQFGSDVLGDEYVNFTVSSSDVFTIEYSMFACLNPLGACGVDIEVIRK